MNIINLVLTGGPYAGKTTALENIKKYLKKNNIPYVTVPETATELKLNGLIPRPDNIMEYQLLVMQRQLVKERDALNYLMNNYKNNELCFIIYDRGIFDNLAYLDSKEQFEELLKKCNLSEIEALDRYDMVLNLQSLATCKPEEYNSIKNNEARTESLPEAIERDKKTSDAWANHRNLKVISSKVSLEEETKIILGYVDELISGINKKYVDKFTIDDSKSNLARYLEMDYVDIIERYLDLNYEDYECKLSERVKNGKTYILEVYKEINGKKIIITDKVLTDYEASSLIKRFATRNISHKKEISFIENGLLYRIALYNDKSLLEVYRNNDKQELIFPEGLTVEKDLSEEKYINHKNDVKKLIKILDN